MRRINVTLNVLAVAAGAAGVACSGGSSAKAVDGAVKDIGFNKPVAPLKANMEASSNNWTEIGAADLSCLGAASTDVPTSVVVALMTQVADFQSGSAVPGVSFG